MMTFCTLFDSFYLDKGLALYHSLEACTDDFRLYIFCFDDKSYEVLQEMNFAHAEVIHHSQIEDENLLKLKQERSKAEYCWTCTPVIIEYVLTRFEEESCTYIDADLYFFHNPRLLFDEIMQENANIVITPHRFADNAGGRRLCRRSGKYCVEFNYFDQSENARKALRWWKESCFAWCYHRYEAERMGDQKYLEKFPTLFAGVHELQHLGGGVAPWNLGQYELDKSACRDTKDIVLKEKKTGKRFPVVFYHFQNIRYLSEDIVNISSGTGSKETKDAIYRGYLSEIEKNRNMLKEYGVTFGVKKIYSGNRLIAFLQGSILRFKVKSLSDIYRLEQFR